jgi:hypothetical protein
MPGSLKDILSHLSTQIDQETLLLYLQDKLSAEKKYEVEKHLLDSEFDSDAVEGLREFRDKQRIAHLVEMLNRDLANKTEKKRKRRARMRLPDQSWLYISIIIILLLIIISYLIIHQSMKRP